MNPPSNNLLENILCHLHPALPGMLFAVLTLLFGFGLGIVFGLNEDMIKSRLKASAAEVRESVYHGNDAAIKTVRNPQEIMGIRSPARAALAGFATIDTQIRGH